MSTFIFLTLGCNKQVPNENVDKETTKSEQSSDQDTITYAVWDTPTGVFNPLISEIMQDSYVNSIVYESLLTVDENGELADNLTEAHELNDEGTELTFKLKKDLLWQDEKPLTSKDIKYTLTSLADPEYTGEYYSTVEHIEGASAYHEGKAQEVTGIETPDEETIIIHFSKPFAPGELKIGTTAILPEHIWSKTRVKDWEKNENLSQPIGSGAYQVKNFKQGEGVEFTAFDKYHEGQPKTKHFNMKVYNSDTAMAELLNGNIDISEISNFKEQDIEKLEKVDIETVKYPSTNVQYLGLNTKDSKLADVKVRQAIAYGIDRQAIVDQLLDGHAELINTPMVPTLWSYPKEGLVEYTKDNEKAKELLKEAGYEDTNNDGIVEKDGQKLSLTLVVPTGNEAREKTGPIIQSQLKEIGIDVQLDPKEFPAVMEQVVENRDYETFLMANTLSADPDPKPNWYSDSSWNFVGYENPETDQLIDEGLEETDQEKRAEIYQEFGQILNRDLPWVPLYVPEVINAYHKSIKGYTPNSFKQFNDIHLWEK